jgi:hypothetical protein
LPIRSHIQSGLENIPANLLIVNRNLVSPVYPVASFSLRDSRALLTKDVSVPRVVRKILAGSRHIRHFGGHMLGALGSIGTLGPGLLPR